MAYVLLVDDCLIEGVLSLRGLQVRAGGDIRYVPIIRIVPPGCLISGGGEEFEECHCRSW